MDMKIEEKHDGTPMASQGILHQEIAGMHHDRKASTTREPYGPAGFHGLFANHYVAMCAAFATIGGLLFGYEYVLPFPNLSKAYVDLKSTAKVSSPSHLSWTNF